VHLGAQAPHVVALVVGGQLGGLGVERLDLGGDGEVLLGHGAVGDAGVDHGHGQGLVFDMRVIWGAPFPWSQVRRKGHGPCEEGAPLDWSVCLTRSTVETELRAITLGHPLLDDYLAFVGARARPNTWLAVAYDLKVFFTLVGKEPTQVTAADVLAFMKVQRAPRRGARVVRLEDGESGLAARTLARRLSSVSGLFAYLVARGDTGVVANPVPRGLATRRPGRGRGKGGVPLVRTPRTLPRVLSPVEVDALLGALRTCRDRAMVEAMLLGGLRRCEVLGLRLSDVNAGERRLFIAQGKGGRQRIVPVSARFFTSLGGYLDDERPRTSATDRLLVVLKGPRRVGRCRRRGWMRSSTAPGSGLACNG
jgi:integrase/recombinase XerD